MKRTLSNLSSLLLTLVMLLSLSVTAFAADSSITFKGAQEGFDFQPGSEYTATDLFDNFKDVMPGDKLSETIQIKNEADDCDYIKLYMKALLHDENGNPISYSESFENIDGKDQANIDEQRDESLVTMADFLSQLTVRIYNGEELIYEAAPSELGALIDYVFLGSLSKGEYLTLKVELDVPVELDNKYANRVGEVDWIFLAECIEYEKLTVHKVWNDNGDPERPESVIVNLLKDGEKEDSIELNESNQWTYTFDELDDQYEWTVEEEVPEGYQVAYEAKDNMVWITNSNDYVPPIEPEDFDLTVKKVWEDEENKEEFRPESVTVSLYKGSELADKVTLNEANNWSHTWKQLDGDESWSVMETGIPAGYVPSYQLADGVVTITNTAQLIQTGQLNWPIPILAVLGMGMVLMGVSAIRRKKQEKNA